MSYSSINLAMISLFPSLIDGDFLGLPIFLFLPVLSSYYTTFLRYLQKILHRLASGQEASEPVVLFENTENSLDLDGSVPS